MNRTTLLAIAEGTLKRPVVAQYIDINLAKLASYAAAVRDTTLTDWNFYLPDPLQDPDAPMEAVAYYMALVSAVQFCFWTQDAPGDQPKHWRYDGKLGSGGMVQLLIDLYNRGKCPGFHLNAEEVLNDTYLALVAAGIPYAKERAEALSELADRTRFSDIMQHTRNIEDGSWTFGTGTAAALAEAFPAAFGDPFLKKAQLALGMTGSNFTLLRGQTVHTKLTAYADYRLPQVLRQLGILVYRPDLAAKVDQLQPLPEGSPAELAIRSATLVACATLAALANVSDAQVDAWLFMQTRAADFQTTARPFHLTVTTAY